jgi:hypothetical protein
MIVAMWRVDGADAEAGMDTTDTAVVLASSPPVPAPAPHLTRVFVVNGDCLTVAFALADVGLAYARCCVGRAAHMLLRASL